MRAGVAVLALVSVGACGRGSETHTTPKNVALEPAADSQRTQQQPTTLLEMVPTDAQHLARIRLAEAMALPLFQSFLSEIRQVPQVARRTLQIEQRCGKDPLQSVSELLVFEDDNQALGADAARSAEMLVQLRRPASWALQCLSSAWDGVAMTEVGGREARRLGSFVVMDAGGGRLVVAHQNNALQALQRVRQAEADPASHQASERVERLGDPLVFGTGAFVNPLGMRSAETIVSTEGESLQFLVTGNMEDAKAARRAVGRLQAGLTLVEALVDSQAQTLQGQQGMQSTGENEMQRHLRTVLENVRIDQTENKVRVALNLPDAETQRFVGGVLARFLSLGRQQQVPPPEGQPRTMPPQQGQQGG